MKKHNASVQGQKIEDVFKTHLLHEESIRNLYHTRLTREFYEIPTANDAEEEWKNIQKAIKKIAIKALGKKKKFSTRNDLNIWT